MQKLPYIPLENQPLFRCFLSVQDPRVPGRCFYPLNVTFRQLCVTFNKKYVSMYHVSKQRGETNGTVNII